jgi:hypothetical protein
MPPAPLGEMPEVSPAQSAIPATVIPAQPGEQAPPLLAGKFKTPAELEQGYVELQRGFGEQGSTLGQLNQHFKFMQDQIDGLRAAREASPAPAQTAPPAGPSREQQEYEALKPVVDAFVAGNPDMGEDAAWAQVLPIYQAAKLAARLEVQPFAEQIPQMTAATGAQILGVRIQEVLSRNPELAAVVQPGAIMQMAQGIDIINMPVEAQAQMVEDLAVVAAHHARKAGQQPVQGYPPNLSYGQPPQQQPQQFAPQQTFGNPPNTLSPASGQQAAPGADPEQELWTNWYMQTWALPRENAAVSAQQRLQMMRGGR